jgi:hypothetical protein
VPRHYIRTTQNRGIPLTGQDHMIATVDAAVGGKTITQTLESSHSPFLSQPPTLPEILIDICGRSWRNRARKRRRSRYMTRTDSRRVVGIDEHVMQRYGSVLRAAKLENRSPSYSAIQLM